MHIRLTENSGFMITSTSDKSIGPRPGGRGGSGENRERAGSVLPARAEEPVEGHGQDEQAAHRQLLVVAGDADHVEAVVDDADDQAADDDFGDLADAAKKEAPPMMTASMAKVS